MTSVAIMEEAHNVLIMKFQMPAEDVNDFINLILSNSVVVETISVLDVIKEDKEDNKILEAAVDSNADYIVSGDRHLKKLGKFMGIEIVPPSEMVKIIKKKGRYSIRRTREAGRRQKGRTK